MTLDDIENKPYLLINNGEGVLRLWKITSHEARRVEDVYVLTIRDLEEENSTTIRSDDKHLIYAAMPSEEMARFVRKLAVATWASHQQTIASIEKAVANAKTNQWHEFKSVAALANHAF